MKKINFTVNVFLDKCGISKRICLLKALSKSKNPNFCSQMKHSKLQPQLAVFW